MHQTRKDMSRELLALQERLRAVLRANMGKARPTRALLRDTERKVEEQARAIWISIETSWYIARQKVSERGWAGDHAPALVQTCIFPLRPGVLGWRFDVPILHSTFFLLPLVVS